MNAREKKKVEMFRGTLLAMNKYKTDWQNKQHIVDTVNTLETKFNLMEEEWSVQTDLKDVATDKYAKSKHLLRAPTLCSFSPRPANYRISPL